PADGDYQIIYSFNSEHGAGPIGSMIKATDGKLYGVIPASMNSAGYIYSVDPNGNQFTEIYDFADSSGGLPWRDLLQASDGRLYGYTLSGGTNHYGVLFSYDL